MERLKGSKRQIVPWGQELVGVNTNTDKKIKVAILDSGIHDQHEDLIGKVTKKFNALEPGKEIRDDFGHGTAIAGIITANHNDGGIVGVNQNIEIYDVKVLDEHGTGEVEDFIKGIHWAMKEGADMINVSFGIQSDNDQLKEAITEAREAGIIIVAAAGNTYGLGVDYPAKYENVLSVAAINKELLRPSSSARGKIDYTAPGVNILSTDHKGGYSLFTGTSFAAGYASGAISVLLANYKSSSLAEAIPFEEFLQKHTFHLAEKKENEYGKGLLTIK
ncbi:S8 family serine peptidase [Pseudobacillus wudalianchiensis]|uniref:S8 family serine peptidase n=1 Tax=Pseudobacillus wudalianchiensis TaxID=1743143 RepID=UPI001FE06AB6|nr:S8 family serine peptidase [Bacillus wudalianchiensis]